MSANRGYFVPGRPGRSVCRMQTKEESASCTLGRMFEEESTGPGWETGLARLVAAALITVASVAAAAGPPGVRFRSLEEATEEARRTGKPVLFFFTAAWCRPCHDLRKSVFEVEMFARLVEEKYVPVEVVDRKREDGANPPDVEALFARMGVNGFPTLAVHRVDGSSVVKLVGFASRETSLSFLREGDRRLREAEEKERRGKK